MGTPGHDPHATGDGAVMLDIGGDIGAVVVVFPEHLLGREVEIVPVGGVTSGPVGGFHAGEHHPAGAPPHVGIVPRQLPAGPTPTAVLGNLTQGRYRLQLVTHHHHHGEGEEHTHEHTHEHEPDGVVVEVDVVGGEVATVTWPDA